MIYSPWIHFASSCLFILAAVSNRNPCQAVFCMVFISFDKLNRLHSNLLHTPVSFPSLWFWFPTALGLFRFDLGLHLSPSSVSACWSPLPHSFSLPEFPLFLPTLPAHSIVLLWVFFHLPPSLHVLLPPCLFHHQYKACSVSWLSLPAFALKVVRTF